MVDCGLSEIHEIEINYNFCYIKVRLWSWVWIDDTYSMVDQGNKTQEFDKIIMIVIKLGKIKYKNC